MRTKILLLALLGLTIQNIAGLYFFNESFRELMLYEQRR